MRKLVAQLLVVALLITWAAPPMYGQESNIGFGRLVNLETLLYGEAQEGALLARLERIEEDVLGSPQSGSAFLVRLERLANLLTGADGAVSLPMRLNAVEWAVFQRINEKPTISRRLDEMEIAIYGQAQSDAGLVERLDSLVQLMWPGGRIYAEDATLAQGTLVRIELLTEINSESTQVNDIVEYRVVDDVVLNHQIVIPSGALGKGRIISVNRSGPLGQDGLVELDFGSIRGIDATRVPLQMAERAIEKNKTIELAAGASIAGVLVLGWAGLAAGYFVRGKPHIVPEGSVFYVEVSRNTRLKALSLVPSGQ